MILDKINKNNYIKDNYIIRGDYMTKGPLDPNAIKALNEMKLEIAKVGISEGL